jgi:hypothetical protein
MILYPTDRARLAIRRDDLVILDMQAGTYACLPGAGRAVRGPGPSGTFEILDFELADLLCASGVLDRTAPVDPWPRPELPELPRRDLLGDPAPRSKLLDVVAIALAYGDMARLFHGRNFAGILDAATRPRAGKAPAQGLDDRVRRQAVALRQWAPWLPFQGECLYRSFLLRRVLRLRGCAALWVFGVQTWPFEAHCWLQIEDTVLDDAADRIAAYTPILAV